ncbi:ATP-grasp domain-containing protein [Mesorhizobium sp. LjNodule214]|uniref:ATP-grasp domain-containing protein n=1 Tax=Mesorhizobium sp. LjNodule214 TaxID=3342252 RepID=UPI003ED0AEBC
MARRALILVEGHSRIGLLYVKAARRLDLHPITLSASPDQYDYLAADGSDAIRVDTGKLDALIHECSRLRATYHIAGLTGFAGDDESVYLTVGKLCQSLELPGPNPLSIERCCNKFTQRQLLAQAGIPIPAYRLAANAAEIESAAADIGLPVVLKPVLGSGSIGVRLCRSVDELTEHATYLLAANQLRQSSPRTLVEEFAEGPHYAVDIMGDEVIGIAAGKFGRPPHFVFREYAHPAQLDDEDYKRIADVSLSCLRALDLGWGPTNIEFRLTKRGPVVVEVNPRLAGGPNPRLVQLAYGVDLVTEHIKQVIGEDWDLQKRHFHAAGARFLVPDRDGTLDWITGDRHAAAVPGVTEVELYVKPNTQINLQGDYHDRVGHVIAASLSLSHTQEILERAVNMINLSISPFATAGEVRQSAAPTLSTPAEVGTAQEVKS